jgi:hypothetical protein
MACAPERVPGSTITQGDAGIAFHSELATHRGAGAPLLRSPGGTSGASYGGGSSSTVGGQRALVNDMPDLGLGSRPCAWVAASEPAVVTRATPSAVERAREAGTDEWFAVNCTAAGETR